MTETSSRADMVRSAGAVAAFGLLTNWPWEFLQVPLYAGMAEADHWEATLVCTQAAFGDAFILLVAFFVVSAVWRGSQWTVEDRLRPKMLFVAVAFLVSMGFEAASVYVLDRWSYAPAMPLLAGLGLSPIVQWILLPPLTLWLARRHALGSRSIRSAPHR